MPAVTMTAPNTVSQQICELRHAVEIDNVRFPSSAHGGAELRKVSHNSRAIGDCATRDHDISRALTGSSYGEGPKEERSHAECLLFAFLADT